MKSREILEIVSIQLPWGVTSIFLRHVWRHPKYQKSGLRLTLTEHFCCLSNADPHHSDAMALVGIISYAEALLVPSSDMHLIEQQVEEAESAFQAALQISESCTAAWFGLGLLEKHFRDNLAGARQHFETAIKYDKYFPNAFCELGWLMTNIYRSIDAKDHHHLIAAQKHIELSVTIDPMFSQGHFILGIAFEQEMDKNAAISCYASALKADPLHSGALSHYGVLSCWQVHCNFEKAREYFQKCIYSDPLYAEGHEQLGILLYKKFNDRKGSITCLKTACSLCPKNKMYAKRLKTVQKATVVGTAIKKAAAKAKENFFNLFKKK